MLKLILQSLAIIAVNIVVGALIGLAFSAFFFRRDPILAAIPALMALPGILLQPWFVLFIFMDGGLLIHSKPQLSAFRSISFSREWANSIEQNALLLG